MRQMDGTPVTVCIPSIGRDSLVRCITSVWGSDLDGMDVNILVVDDGIEGSVERVIATMAPSNRTVRVVRSNAQNISVARNFLLDHADTDLVCFVDDDEQLVPNALRLLLKAMNEHDADAAFGSVKGTYPPETPEWCLSVRPFDRQLPANGTKVATGATGLVMFNLRKARAAGVRFDVKLGKTGGEDTDYFAAFSKSGAKLVSCPEAVAYEDVTPDRLDIGHILRRYTRGGQSYARSAFGNRGPAARGKALVTVLAKATVATTAAAAAKPFGQARHMRWRIKAAGQYGQLRHLLGRSLQTLY